MNIRPLIYMLKPNMLKPNMNIRESFTIRDTKIHLLISPNMLFSLTFLFKFEGHRVRIFASVNVEEDWDPET